MTESTVLDSSWGGTISCPSNAVISAACGSGGSPNCYKDNQYYTAAIRCDTLDPSYFSGGSTSINTDYDITGAVCKANEVATAACFSGSDANCAVPNAGNARNVVECRTLVSNAWQTSETPVWSNEFMGTWWGSTWKGGPVSTAGSNPASNVALCNPGYVATGFCNSGENWNDCVNNNSELNTIFNKTPTWGYPFTYVKCGKLKQPQATVVNDLGAEIKMPSS